MDSYIYDSILAYQEDNPESAMVVLRQFAPLIKHYGKKLHLEDAEEELQISLLQVIKRIDLENLNDTSDAVLIAYIQKSIYYRFLALLKREKYDNHFIYAEDLNYYGKLNFEKLTSHYDNYDLLLKIDMERKLTKFEYIILNLYLFEGLPVSQIAKRLKKSRQCVNQCKKRALRKMCALYYPQ